MCTYRKAHSKTFVTASSSREFTEKYFAMENFSTASAISFSVTVSYWLWKSIKLVNFFQIWSACVLLFFVFFYIYFFDICVCVMYMQVCACTSDCVSMWECMTTCLTSLGVAATRSRFVPIKIRGTCAYFGSITFGITFKTKQNKNDHWIRKVDGEKNSNNL